jgi:hypothetical protein
VRFFDFLRRRFLLSPQQPFGRGLGLHFRWHWCFTARISLGCRGPMSYYTAEAARFVVFQQIIGFVWHALDVVDKTSK